MNRITALIRGFFEFLLILYRRRSLILEMAKRDVSSHHTASFLGFFWTFVNPLIMIFILWFVFSFAFKSSPRSNVPFVVWLAAGMCIWNTFVEIVTGSTTTIVANSHLVKRIVFPLSILPVVKLVGSLITHVIFLILLALLIIILGLPVSFYWVQAVYYFFAMSVLAVGLGWIASSINVFARDTGQFVNVLLQFGFWGTPIFWDSEMLPEWARSVSGLNPLVYIVQGYRDSFINFVPFWQHGAMTIYFWAIAGIIFIAGAIIFLRLRPHFADVI